MIALAQLTFREALAKKTFMAFFACSTLFLILLIFAFQIDVVQGNEALLKGFGEDFQNNETNDLFNVEDIYKYLIGGVGVGLLTGGIFLSIFATAGLIPSMLEKGSIDLLLSKPLNRIQVLSGRSLGALAIVFVNITYLIFGIWLILGMKTGIWVFSVLYIIPVVCLVFMIIYSWMALWGVLLSNSALTIMITYLMFGLSSMLLARDHIYAFLSSKIYAYILDFFFYLFPRISEMIKAPIDVLDNNVGLIYEPYINSLVVAVIIFGLAGYIFQKKEY